MDEFIKQNWFKVAIILLVLLAAFSIFYYYVIFLPSEKRADRDREDAKVAAEEEKEQNLATCLGESEYQQTSSHLWRCGTLGRVPTSCTEIFAGAKSTLSAYAEYIEYFEKDDDFFGGFDEFDVYVQECNCGLEKYIRDELDAEEENRDQICFNLYQ